MAFKILVRDDSDNIQVVHEINDRRVTRVGVSGSSGEVGAMNVAPGVTELLLTFEYAKNDGRPNLVDLEALENPERTGDQADAAVAKLAALPTATNTGPDVIQQSQEVAAEPVVVADEPQVASGFSLGGSSTEE